ncbi:hypothetical protein FGU46_08445 [Methanobacterium sp. CWC-01]|uniref:hypothetical protein n=1 Tax=Methanobacterium aridiramus TaxID=2584467 RepID=UPI002578412B|nr:hypothetical protein [Methanobacterium sp. CWC-01]WJI10115.1 hypothetical protein FGU46_08445 [Methanobacterium sp. CWC-01]
MDPQPIVGTVKNCKVECRPQDLKPYGEGVKVMIVSEKLFLEMIASLSEMEEDLTQLKALNIHEKVKRMERITRDLGTKFKALSYREYLGEEKDEYLK